VSARGMTQLIEKGGGREALRRIATKPVEQNPTPCLLSCRAVHHAREGLGSEMLGAGGSERQGNICRTPSSSPADFWP
jgi:hypothetical protein